MIPSSGTFQYNVHNPPLLFGSRTIVNTLQYLGLNISRPILLLTLIKKLVQVEEFSLFTHVLGKFIQNVVQVVDRQGTLNN